MPSLLELKRTVQPAFTPPAPINQSFQAVSSALDTFASSALAVGQLRQGQQARENKVELGTARVAANIDIRDNINRIKEENLNPKTFDTQSLGRFENAAQGYLEGVLPSIAEGNRDAVTNASSLYIEQAKEKIRTQMRVTATHRMQADLGESYLKSKQDAEIQAFEGDPVSAAGINAQVNQQLNLALDSGLISAEKFVSFKDSLTKSLQENTYLGDFHRALETDETDAPLSVQEKFQKGEEYLANFQKAKNTGLAPQEKERLVIKMKGQLRARRQSIQVRGSKIKEEMDDVVVQIQNGVVPENAPEVQALVAQSMPNQALIFQRRIDNAKFFSAASEQIKYLSAPQRERATASIRKEIDLTKPGAAKRMETFNKIEQESKRQMKEFTTDPARYVDESPEVQAAIQSYNDSGQRSILTPEEDARHLAQIKAQASLAMQANMGLPKEKRRVLNNSEAGSIAQRIRESETVADQAGLISVVGDRYGKYSSTALKDLNRAGIPFSSMLYNSLLKNGDTISLTPDANEAWSSKTSDLEKAVKDSIDIRSMRADVSQELSPYFETLGNGATTPIINNITDQSYKLSLVLARKVGREDAVKQGASAILAHYDFDTFNGVTFRMPNTPDLNTSQVVDIGNLVRSKLLGVKGVKLFEDEDPTRTLDLEVPPFYFPELSVENRERLYRDDLISNSHFQTLPDDSGVFLADRSGSPVKLKNGRQFSFSFSDLANPSSPINLILNGPEGRGQRIRFAPLSEQELFASPLDRGQFLSGLEVVKEE